MFVLKIKISITSFILADAGFDVWLGNSRGNTYATNHVNYSVTSDLFWDFSVDELVKYDLDATFDVILSVTKQRSLYYVGFSQGTLIMFVKLSQDPKFASKVRKFFALGPVGTVSHVKGLFKIFATKFYSSAKLMHHFFGTKFFARNNHLIRALSLLICDNYFLNPLCSDVLFQIAGPKSNQFNMSRLSVYVAGEGGTSVKNMIHWIQMVNSGKLQAYDYDSVAENRIHYGSDSPTIYDLSSVNAPIYLYWGFNDWLANPIDIKESLLSVLPKMSIRENKAFKDYNHLDFIWGLRAADDIYQPIISIINRERDEKFAQQF